MSEIMVKITKKNASFDYPEYKEARVKESPPESLFAQNSLLKFKILGRPSSSGKENFRLYHSQNPKPFSILLDTSDSKTGGNIK